MIAGNESEPGSFAGLRFPIVFSLLTIVFFILNYSMPYRLDYRLRELTSLGAVFMAKNVGLHASIEPWTVINIEGKRLSIVSECTSLIYIMIFTAAVTAYPATFRKKFYGLLAGIPAIAFLNSARIVFLGWLGCNYPAYFKLFHDYLWEGGFLVVVLLMWMIWINPFTAETQRRGEETSLAFWERVGVRVPLVFASSMVLTYSFSDEYLRLLASISNNLIHTSGFDGGVVRSDGKGLFLILWGEAPREISVGIYYFLPFLVLSLLSQRDDISKSSLFLRLLTGTTLLTLLHIGAVVSTFTMLGNGATDWRITAISAGVFISPLLLWLFLFPPFTARKTDREVRP